MTEDWKRKDVRVKRKLHKSSSRLIAGNSGDPPYRLYDADWLSLKIRRPCEKGHLKSFIVKLNVCMSEEEVKRRVENAFGDLT